MFLLRYHSRASHDGRRYQKRIRTGLLLLQINKVVIRPQDPASRKPGVCTNTFTVPITVADEAVLDTVEHEALGLRFIEELLALVDRGDADDDARLMADRDRLRAEVERLVGSIAAGVPADTVAPAIRQREAEIARLDVTLRAPRQAPPNIEKLRAALEQRAAEWRATLRAEPTVARRLLRRLIGPLEMWDPVVPSAEWTEWEALLTPALLEGLAPIQVVASPTRIEKMMHGPLKLAA